MGQDDVVNVLRNASARDNLAHAYLFYGSRGSGKTTAARILAKIANCETRGKNLKFRAEGEPCNTCEQCMAIDSGRSLDVVEIDAASNRGIDEIRDLKEGIALTPVSGKHKIYIIDEVHQLTKDAFNALLKTLEEPPAHAIFVLATTEYEKMPATIISRTQRFHFKKIPLAIIIQKLKAIAKAENFRITADALALIAQAGEGSLRDSESLLDQMTSLEDEVDATAVERSIGKVGLARVSALADLIIKEKLSEVLKYLRAFEDSGFNVVDLNKELIHYLRRVLSVNADASLLELFRDEFGEENIQSIKAQAMLIHPERHIPLLRALIRAHSEMRYSPFAGVPLEVALIAFLSGKKTGGNF